MLGMPFPVGSLFPALDPWLRAFRAIFKRLLALAFGLEASHAIGPTLAKLRLTYEPRLSQATRIQSRR